VDDDERERRLRRRFGPPVSEAPPAAAPPRRPLRRLIAAGTVLAVVAAAAGAFLLLTPHDHVAPGCWWWTARTVGQVVAGSRGCVRGVYVRGGEIADGTSPQEPVLSFFYTDPDQPGGHPACAYRGGDAIVLRYHAVFDDGRTIIVVDGCR
jgi:hypothetical protein